MQRIFFFSIAQILFSGYNKPYRRTLEKGVSFARRLRGIGESGMKNTRSWTGVVLFLFIALLLGIPSIKDYIQLKSAPDIYDLKESDYKKGKMVCGKADMVMDYYCYETNDGNETYRWYLVPCQGDMISKYIGIKVNAKLFNDYDAVFNSTKAFFEGTSESLKKAITFQGRLKKVDGDIEKSLNDYIDYICEDGASDQKDAFVPYYIELKTTKGSIINIIISAVCLGIAVVIFIIMFLKSKSDKKFEATAQQMRENQPWNNGMSLVIDDQELDRMAYEGSVINNNPQTDSADAPADNNQDNNNNF